MSDQRPRTWGECKERKLTECCPFVSCRYHLGLDAFETGSIAVAPRFERVAVKHVMNVGVAAKKLNKWSQRNETCALAVAESGPRVLDDIAKMLHVSRERIRQMEAKMLERFRKVRELRELSNQWEPSDKADQWEHAEDLKHNDVADFVAGVGRLVASTGGKMHGEFGAMLLRGRRLTRKQRRLQK